MTEWPALCHLVDAVIVFTLIEAAVLIALHRRSGRGVPPHDFIVNLAAGLSLMLALRAAVADAAWWSVVLLMLLAGLLHAADIWLRWRRGTTPHRSR